MAYPLAYISFHTYSIQVRHILNTFKENNRWFLLKKTLKTLLDVAGSFRKRVPWGSVCCWRSEEYIRLRGNRRRLPNISRANSKWFSQKKKKTPSGGTCLCCWLWLLATILLFMFCYVFTQTRMCLVVFCFVIGRITVGCN